MYSLGNIFKIREQYYIEKNKMSTVTFHNNYINDSYDFDFDFIKIQ